MARPRIGHLEAAWDPKCLGIHPSLGTQDSGPTSLAHLQDLLPCLPPLPGQQAFLDSLTVSWPCPVFRPPAHTNSHGSNMLSHANCYGILSPCLCPSPQGLPLGRFREENGIFQAVWAFRDLLVQPPSWMDGKTEVQRREEGIAQSHTGSLPGLALTQVL